MTTPPPWEPAPGQPGQPPGSGPPTWDPSSLYAAGPVYPAPGVAPGAVPGYPWHAPAYLDPTDPLVPPPGAGFPAWSSRVTASLRRSWRSLAIILGLTQALPTLLFSVGLLVYFGTSTYTFEVAPGEEVPADEFGAAFAVALVPALVFALMISFTQALGYAAATWTMVREAAGEPAPLGAALRYGVGRMVGVWGWSLVYGLIVAGGLCLCLIPGLYFGAALALFGPVYLFEREHPIGRSWRMFHDNVGQVLGRVATILAVGIAFQVVVSIVQNLVSLPIAATGSSAAQLPVAVFGAVLGAVGLVPPAMYQTAGLVIAYAEQRARQGPLGTPGLLAELS